MGSLADLAGKSVYLDANVFIYFLEGISPFADLLGRMFAEIDAERIRAVKSELTLAELLVKPMRDGNQQAIARYEQIVQPRRGFDVISISRSILSEAARTRATTQLKLPDAIHVATAYSAGCKCFLTNDRRMNAGNVRLHWLDELTV